MPRRRPHRSGGSAKQANPRAAGGTPGPIHPQRTDRSGHQYCFYWKHHGRPTSDPACWCREVSQADEFEVFNLADRHDLSSQRGWLYGILRDSDDEVRTLGTLGQQVAEFPFARPSQDWHGYPLWPLSEAGPENRRGERSKPPKIVFQKMQDKGVLSYAEHMRLAKGAHL
jgi:hypothetical protein